MAKRQIVYKRLWRAANRERVRAQGRKDGKAWRRRNPDKVREQNRNKRLSRSEYVALLTFQKGVCAICEQSQILCIDHDHTNDQVRGLLCKKCNSALGLLGDTYVRLQRATEYLGNPPYGRSRIHS